MSKWMDNLFVPYFSPETSQNVTNDLSSFLSGCELAWRGLRAEDFDVFIRCVLQRLHGSAYSITENFKFISKEQLYELLRKNYLVVKPLSQVRFDISNCRQSSGENVTMFARRLDELGRQAKIAMDSEFGSVSQDDRMWLEINKALCAAFKTGVHPRMQAPLLASRSSKLQDLVEIAKDLEITLSGCGEAHINYYSGNSNGMRSNPFRDNNFDVEKVNAAKAVKFDLRQSKPDCSFCGKAGHLLDECYKRRNSPYCTWCGEYGHSEKDSCKKTVNKNTKKSVAVPASGGNNYNKVRSSIECFFCKKKGHMLKDCWSKKKQDEAGNASRPSQGQ